MAKLPFDAQKIYHFLRDHPEWDVTYHELPWFLLVGYLPFVPSHWVTLRNHRRDICVRISCDRKSVDGVITEIAALIDTDPYVQPDQLEHLG
ncbi:hypothetical protein C7271_25085 [filamentous cyanobacterium CCP5]|nr:hypothetical protein C7271_25085 [filamentous cyanobacterium CCP5]